MAKKITPGEHIETFFRTCKPDEGLVQYDRIALMLRTRGIIQAPEKRRNKKQKLNAATLPKESA